MNDRIKHIDIAKGISISLVALFHSGLGNLIPAITEPMSLFRIPLFFFLSGVFFSLNTTTKEFLFKKSEALLKPYFIVLITVLLIHVTTGEEHILSKFTSILYGNGSTLIGIWIPMWFLTHLFAVYCFTFVTGKLVQPLKLSWNTKLLSLMVLLLVSPNFIDLFVDKSMLTSPDPHQLIGLPFSFDLILITSCFFLFGKLLRTHILNFTPNKLWVMVAIISFLCVVNFTEAHTNFYAREYKSPLFSTLGAIVGIYVVLTISWLLARKHWLSVIPLALGKGSLFILIFHVPLNDAIATYFASIMEDGYLLTSARVFSYLLSIFIPLGIRWVVMRSSVLSLGFFPVRTNRFVRRMGSCEIEDKA